jgi:hypothetical protein
MAQIPTSPTAKACFDAIDQHAPALAAELQDRLLPLASDASQTAADRIRELRRIGDSAWQSFREQDDGGRVRALGKSWPCCVEDVAAAVALEALSSGDRAELEGALAALQEAHSATLSTTRASMRLRGALAAAT